MVHNVSVLTNVAQCDQFLSANQVNRGDLEYAKANLTNRIINGASAAEEIGNELIAAEATLTLLNNLLTTTPQGDGLNDLLDEINDTENEIIRLKRRKRSNGPVTQFMREVDLDIVMLKMTACDEIQVQVETRKSEIESSSTA